MSSEGWITCRWGQDGYGLLIRNYPVTLSLWHCLVKIIPHIHLLTAFSLRYRHFLGGQDFDCMALSWPEKPCGSSPASHRNCCTVNICFRGPACTLLWRPAVLWLERFAFSYHSLSLSSLFLYILLLPTYYCQSHFLRCLQLSPIRLFEIRQPVFSLQWSHLCACTSQPSFTGNWRYIGLVSFVDFPPAGCSCQETDGKFSVPLF